jgi:PleD family two-component response regulator
MITGARDSVVHEHALKHGVTDFLVKPVDPVELSARLDRLVAARASPPER